MSRENDPYPRSYSAIIFLICSALLFLSAIGIFIWLLIDAAEDHIVKNILYGSAFLVITLGVLIYSLCAYKSPKTASIILWITMALGIASFIVGLCLKNPERDIIVYELPAKPALKPTSAHTF